VRAKVERAEVAAELLPGAPIELLQDLHLLTRGGDLNADARRKLKQIRHLLQLLGPALDDLLARFPDVATVVDCGAGKSYLGFLLYVDPAGPDRGAGDLDREPPRAGHRRRRAGGALRLHADGVRGRRDRRRAAARARPRRHRAARVRHRHRRGAGPRDRRRRRLDRGGAVLPGRGGAPAR
jgi:hypothetical protein